MQLVKQWIDELHLREDFGNVSLKEWATPRNLNIVNFKIEKAAAFYPEIFKRRFYDDPETGYAFLEDSMSNTRTRR